MIYWVGFIYLFNRLSVLTDSCFWDLAILFILFRIFPWNQKAITKFVSRSQHPSLFKGPTTLPKMSPLFIFFVFQPHFFIPSLRHFIQSPDLIINSQSANIIQHNNFPLIIALKKSISSNQPQPFKSWWNKPKLNPFAFFSFCYSMRQTTDFCYLEWLSCIKLRRIKYIYIYIYIYLFKHMAQL